ncbi:MAG: outer membrane beta-barrel protein [Pseudomonadota bacterium]
MMRIPATKVLAATALGLTLGLALAATSAVAADGMYDGAPGSTYTGLRGSLAFEGSINGTDKTTTPPTTIKAGASTGGGASVYWGWHLPYNFKTELELLYRYQPLSDLTAGGTSVKLGGYAQTFAPMANVYWTLPLDIGVSPFVGGGVGYAWNELGVNNIAGVALPGTAHDDDWRFAYNLMAGLSVPVSNGTRITGMYRWLRQDIGGDCSTNLFCSGHAATSSIDIGIEIDL